MIVASHNYIQIGFISCQNQLNSLILPFYVFSSVTNSVHNINPWSGLCKLRYKLKFLQWSCIPHLLFPRENFPDYLLPRLLFVVLFLLSLCSLLHYSINRNLLIMNNVLYIWKWMHRLWMVHNMVCRHEDTCLSHL